MTIFECFNASNEDLRLEDLDQLLKMLQQRQDELRLVYEQTCHFSKH